MAEKQVNVRVPEQVKQQWDEAIENSDLAEYRSLTDLIRISVQRELAGQHQGYEDQFSPSSGSTDEALSELLDASRETNRLLNQVNQDIQTVRREVTTDDELTELMDDVFRVLPEGEESERDYSAKRDRQKAKGLENPEERIGTGFPEDLAERFDTSPRRIEEAISQLQEDMPGMIGQKGDFYYRES